MIDFHTHILPELDDGAETAEIALELIKQDMMQGVNKIVFTPHYYGNKYSPERFLERREEAFKQIKAQIADGVEVKCGAEVYFTEKEINSDFALCNLAIEGTKYVLLELPFLQHWSEELWYRLSGFRFKTGYIPVIAHVERYEEIRKTPSLLTELIEMGCLLQCNTSSFIDAKSREMLLKMLEKNLVHCLGTDTHNLSSRAPEYAAAKEIIRAAGLLDKFDKIQDNMNKMWLGEEISLQKPQELKRFLKKYY